MPHHVAVSPPPAPPGSLPQNGPDSCLHRWFEAQAVRTPHIPAVTFDGGALTYAQLNARANQLAHCLRARGVGPGALVGICVERSLEMVAGLLGVLKAGAAYVPLDPNYPAERLQFMLEDTQAAVLLTQARLRDSLPAHPATLALDADWPEIARQSGDNFICGATPDDLAYVIYTSGSTGTPKGVPIAHRSACSNLRWRQQTFPLGADDRMLQTYSFSFDPSVWAFFWPLVTGARLVLPRPDGHGDSGYLVQTIVGERISVLGFGPAMLGALLDEPGIEQCRSLRHVFCGGEALPGALARRFHDLLPADLHNVYGPTEATIDATWWTCQRGAETDTVPIGHPLPQTQAYLLGEDGQSGAEGELCLAGVGLSPGYLNRPELTAQKFIANPFGAGRLYRTGDLARRRPDGALEYGGRLDHQVKLRGFRIELGEIEAALLRRPGVKEAAVIAREDRPGDKRLAAYVVAGPDDALKVSELRDALTGTLPAFMVPSRFVLLPSLPLTPNGKVDRNALLALKSETPGGDARERGEPADAREALVLSLWEELLPGVRIGVRDNFFEIGGHSLLAVQMVQRLGQITGRRIPLAALFADATVTHLARVLGGIGAANDGAGVPDPMIAFHPQGAKAPFFFLHGDFGGGFFCAALARHLGPDQPFYTLPPHGMGGAGVPPTIEDMAAEYAALIRSVQPHGPYRLGGFCNGGLVAFEVAQQLLAQGERVDLLVLMDMDTPVARCKIGLHGLAKRAGRGLGLSARAQHRGSAVLQKASTPLWLALKKVRGGAEKMTRAFQRKQGPDWAALMPEAYRKAPARYTFRPYPGRITLLQADESHLREELAGWREIADAVDLRRPPGNHATCLTVHNASLAAHLHACLEQTASDGQERGETQAASRQPSRAV